MLLILSEPDFFSDGDDKMVIKNLQRIERNVQIREQLNAAENHSSWDLLHRAVKQIF